MSKLYSWTCDELIELLGHFTTITLNNTKSTCIKGYLYTVDPESHHVVLLVEQRVQVVMSHAIETITIDKEDCMDLQILDDLLKYSQENKYTQEWIHDRKIALIQHLKENRIPIEYGDNDDEPVIHVLGSARVESPYVATSVLCDNALIRKRVRDIILQLSR